MAKKITREAAIKAADAYRKSKLQLEQVEAEIMNQTALLKNERAEELDALAAEMQKCEECLATFTEQNREEVLANKKSADFAGVKIGYRKSAAKLEVNEGNDWAKVEGAINADKILSQQFINATPKLDKSALKKAHSSILENLGLRIEQEENFFVKL